MDASPFCLVAFIVYVAASAWILSSFPRPRAVALVMLIALLFLPEKVGFDAPLVPPITKFSLPAVIFALVLLFDRTKVNGSRLFWVWLLLSCIATSGTIVTNPDPLPVGPGIVLNGLVPWDFVSIMIAQILTVGVPFEMARRAFRTKDDVVELFRVVAGCGVVYAFLMMVEMRLSPQLHNWVYGFHQHDFSQAMRGGGFRSLVFMSHGLATAMFCLSAVIASITLAKLGQGVSGISAKPIAWFLSAILFLARSMGAAVYGVVALPLLWRAKARTVVRVALLLSLVVVLMPLLRVTDLFPVEKLTELAIDWNHERGGSLKFRFDNEAILLEKWSLRPWFGWGGFSRSHVFDPSTGRDISITDGYWIIMLGEAGVLGFVVMFSLLLWPVWMASKTFKRGIHPEAETILAGLALVVAFATVDLVPNGLFNNLLLFLVGALTGFCEGQATASVASHASSPTPAPQLARAS